VTRGKPAEEGELKVAQNGYTYKKVGNRWKLLHHVIAEEKLGREIAPDEMVCFIDKNRNNLAPKNILVKKRNKGLRQRKEALEAQIIRLQEELAIINQRITEREKLGSTLESN
jgi:hypothetical protein